MYNRCSAFRIFAAASVVFWYCFLGLFQLRAFASVGATVFKDASIVCTLGCYLK